MAGHCLKGIKLTNNFDYDMPKRGMPFVAHVMSVAGQSIISRSPRDMLKGISKKILIKSLSIN